VNSATALLLYCSSRLINDAYKENGPAYVHYKRMYGVKVENDYVLMYIL
jgi:hypothetical protein